jgi:hypothetical protein
MTTKADLHRLVDELPDTATEQAAIVLRDLRDPLLAAVRSAPLDDEEETDEEHRAMREAYAERAAGQAIAHAALRREFGV